MAVIASMVVVTAHRLDAVVALMAHAIIIATVVVIPVAVGLPVIMESSALIAPARVIAPAVVVGIPSVVLRQRRISSVAGSGGGVAWACWVVGNDA
jgi:hypothetical protein